MVLGHGEDTILKFKVTVLRRAGRPVFAESICTRQAFVCLRITEYFWALNELGVLTVTILVAQLVAVAEVAILAFVVSLALPLHLNIGHVLNVRRCQGVLAHPLHTGDPVPGPGSTLGVGHAGLPEGRGGGVLSTAEDGEEGDHENDDAVHEILHANSPWTICGPVIGLEMYFSEL